MLKSKKSHSIESTSFSDFIRNANSGKKKKIFSIVLKKASEDQKHLVEKALKKHSKFAQPHCSG